MATSCPVITSSKGGFMMTHVIISTVTTTAATLISGIIKGSRLIIARVLVFLLETVEKLKKVPDDYRVLYLDSCLA